MDILWIIIGLVLLFVGGESLVRGASGLALRLGLPPLVIGLTVVGFGTSTPELLVSLQAAFAGSPAIAIGNIVGSNIGNILLILGVAALIWPMTVEGGLRRDLTWMMGAALILVPLFWLGVLPRWAAIPMLGGLAAYVWIAIRDGREAPSEDGDAIQVMPVWMALGIIVLGLVGLMIGARFLVDGAVNLARDLGLSEAFIGLTIVAAGTSLPELATSVIAALRKQSAIAIGNIVGSNIYNVLGILGATALIAPIPVEARFFTFDLPVMISVSLVLTAILWRGGSIGRIAGAAFLVAYAVYVWAAQAY